MKGDKDFEPVKSHLPKHGVWNPADPRAGGPDIKMNAKQFAWLYLIENGSAGMEYNYYGGHRYTEETVKLVPGLDMWDYKTWKKATNFFQEQIRRIGVDWSKTDTPRSDIVSEFQGTFCEPGRKEILTGTLVLKDGTEQEWNAEALEVKNVFEMMAAVSNAEDRFKEIFG